MLVTCAVIVNEGMVLCARRGPGMSLPGKWEFPGGKMEPGERSEDCLIREIREELGITVTVVQSLRETHYNYPGGPSLTLIPMICRIAEGTPEVTEHSEIIWKEVAELRSLDWADADVEIVETLISKPDLILV